MIMTFNSHEYEILDVSGRDPLPSFKLNKIPLKIHEETSKCSLANRLITVRLLLEGNNRSEVNQKIDKLNQEMFTFEQRQQLIFNDMNRYWMATCQQITTIKEHEIFAELRLIFDCYPLSFDVDMITTQSNTIKNDSSFKTEPVIEFSLPSGTKQFVCSISGTISKISLIGDNLAGNWKIDAQERKIYLNGALEKNKFDFENSLWHGFELLPGKDTVLQTYPVGITLKTSYRRRWL